MHLWRTIGTYISLKHEKVEVSSDFYIDSLLKDILRTQNYNYRN